MTSETRLWREFSHRELLEISEGRDGRYIKFAKLEINEEEAGMSAYYDRLTGRPFGNRCTL
jgi:hypothetical protein